MKRPQVHLSRGQWTILGMLLATMALEFVFSSYWRTFYTTNIVVKGDTGKNALNVTREGLMVAAFMVFGVFVLVTLSSVSYRAAFAIAGLMLLAVTLARTGPIIDWLDETTTALTKASGA